MGIEGVILNKRLISWVCLVKWSKSGLSPIQSVSQSVQQHVTTTSKDELILLVVSKHCTRQSIWWCRIDELQNFPILLLGINVDTQNWTKDFLQKQRKTKRWSTSGLLKCPLHAHFRLSLILSSDYSVIDCTLLRLLSGWTVICSNALLLLMFSWFGTFCVCFVFSSCSHNWGCCVFLVFCKLVFFF